MPNISEILAARNDWYTYLAENVADAMFPADSDAERAQCELLKRNVLTVIRQAIRKETESVDMLAALLLEMGELPGAAEVLANSNPWALMKKHKERETMT